MIAKGMRILTLVVVAVLCFMLAGVVRRNTGFRPDTTVTVPGGPEVTAHLVKAVRVGSDRVKVTIHYEWDAGYPSKLTLPDFVLTRPRAVHDVFAPLFCLDTIDAMIGGKEVACSSKPELSHGAPSLNTGSFTKTTTFQMLDPAWSIDICQPVYRAGATTCVDVPLRKGASRRQGSLSAEVVDIQRWSRFRRMDWIPPDPGIGDPKASGIVTKDPMCVVVRITRHGQAPRIPGYHPDSGGFFTAKLMRPGIHGLGPACAFQRMADCTPRRTTWSPTSASQRLLTGVGRAVTLGHASVEARTAIEATSYEHGDGVWIYVFDTKDISAYRSIRIPFAIPPGPKDIAQLRFTRIPI